MTSVNETHMFILVSYSPESSNQHQSPARPQRQCLVDERRHEKSFQTSEKHTGHERKQELGETGRSHTSHVTYTSHRPRHGCILHFIHTNLRHYQHFEEEVHNFKAQDPVVDVILK